MGLVIPVLNTSSIFIQVGWTPNSDASFVRAQNVNSDELYVIGAGSGSTAKDLAEVGWAFPYARIELQTVQVDDRVFGVISKV